MAVSGAGAGWNSLKAMPVLPVRLFGAAAIAFVRRSGLVIAARMDDHAHTLAIADNGLRIFAWGSDKHGQLGLGSAVFTKADEGQSLSIEGDDVRVAGVSRQETITRDLVLQIYNAPYGGVHSWLRPHVGGRPQCPLPDQPA